MTSSAINTEPTPNDSNEALTPIKNLCQPQEAADEYGESHESEVNDSEPGEDDLEDDNDDAEDVENFEDSYLRGKQKLETIGDTSKKGDIRPPKDTKTDNAEKKEEEKKAEEEKTEGKK